MGPTEQVVEWPGVQVPSLFLATGLCKDLGPVILGLSLAQWSPLGFRGILAATLGLIHRDRTLSGAWPGA